MTIDVITKAPADVLDFDFNFERWMPSGDRISAATAVIDGASAVVDRVDTSDTVARVWISTGVTGEYGLVTVTISTSEGRTKQVSAVLKIREP